MKYECYDIDNKDLTRNLFSTSVSLSCSSTLRSLFWQTTSFRSKMLFCISMILPCQIILNIDELRIAHFKKISVQYLLIPLFLLLYDSHILTEILFVDKPCPRRF